MAAPELVRETPVSPKRARELSGSEKLMLTTFAWLDERFKLRDFVQEARDFYYGLNLQMPKSHTEKYKLRSIWYWYPMYSLGSLSLIAFGVATLTGIILALYYVPSLAPVEVGGEAATEAWRSMVYIMTEVPFGFMIRALHFWSAMIMVAVVFLHMMRVYFTQGYKKPRELNWVIGVVLLILTLGLGYTGYILPWSQLSYWAGTIGVNMASSSPPPFLGQWAAGLVFGGTSMTQATLVRMYVYHVVLLPLLIVGAIGLHLFIVWIQGIAEPH
ncbi:MAG: cytochrome b [Methanobacteriota archaeon]